MSNDFEPHILQNLLAQIGILIKHDEKVKAEKQLRGENFNVFTVLGFYHQEVKLHSGFIAELLNINGSHGLKDAFLKSFIHHAGIDDLIIDTSKCKTAVEFYIGPIINTQGGQMDILIESSEAAIIIENKVNADDTEKQLLRYYNFANSKKYKNGFKLIYLTLDGRNPGDYTTGGQVPENEITCISYREVILNWLNHSVEIAARQPLVRESIIQYISIIKKLTGQNMENESNDELMTILSDSASTIKASFVIEQNLWKLKRHILKRVKVFQEEIMNEINKQGDFEIEKIIYDDDYDEKESGYSFLIKNWINHKIKFSFANKWYSGLYYGIVNKTENESLSEEQCKKLVESLNGYKLSSSVWWTCNREPSDSIYQNNWGMETFVNIANTTTDDFKQFMKTAILELLTATKDLEM
jgi:hypothetical protein